ncbi:protein kinase [Cavenderia fasciculata]|uniref:non-specific serine/threonine protein kinase n=1 Tax=Cavenderia fasciculata TaxID=261658 RepID=F4PML0_CACFS|nr:protein kinase [Cavenderia fasciculata]EGG23657.1 protein kinase [Cavenderia fasciculata]|eukprot:XP_004361508.1 protein kinase [Cavenderia fasciculata]
MDATNTKTKEKLLSIINDIAQQDTTSSYSNKASQKAVAQYAQIRSLLPELVNSVLISTASAKDVHDTVLIIRLVTQKVPSGDWIGDKHAISQYLFRLIPILTNPNHMQRESLHEDIVRSISLLITLLSNNLKAATAFLLDTMDLLKDLHQVMEMDLQIEYPILIDSYRRLKKKLESPPKASSSLSSKEGSDKKDKSNNNNNNNKGKEKDKEKEREKEQQDNKEKDEQMKIDGEENNNNNNNNQNNEKKVEITLRGLVINLPSIDMLMMLYKSLFDVFAYLLEHKTFGIEIPFLIEHINLLLQNASRIQFSKSFKLLNCPNNYHHQFIKSLFRLATINNNMTEDIVAKTQMDDVIGEVLSRLLTIISNHQFIAGTSDCISKRIPLILSYSKSILLKNVLCLYYYRLLEISEPKHYSIFNMIIYLNDKDIQNNLVSCFRYVFKVSLEKEALQQSNSNSNPNPLQSDKQLSSQLMDTLLTSMKIPIPLVVTPTLDDIDSGRFTALANFITGYSSTFRLCKEFYGNNNIILEHFVTNVSKFYNFLLSKEKLNIYLFEIYLILLELCLDIVKGSHSKMEEIIMGSQYKYSLDNIHNIVFLLWTRKDLFETIKVEHPNQFSYMTILAINIMAWMPSQFFHSQRKEQYLKLLYELKQQSSPIENTLIQPSVLKTLIGLISAIPIILVNLYNIENYPTIYQETIQTLNEIVENNETNENILEMIGLIGGSLICFDTKGCFLQPKVIEEIHTKEGGIIVNKNSNILALNRIEIDNLLVDQSLLALYTNIPALPYNVYQIAKYNSISGSSTINIKSSSSVNVTTLQQAAKIEINNETSPINIWLPRCACHYFKSKKVLLNRDDVAAKHQDSKFTPKYLDITDGGFLFSKLFGGQDTSSQGDTLTRYMYTKYTFKSITDHVSPMQGNVLKILSLIIPLLSGNSPVCKVAIPILSQLPQLGDFAFRLLFRELKPLSLPSDDTDTSMDGNPAALNRSSTIISIIRLFGKLSALLPQDSDYQVAIFSKLIECLGRDSAISNCSSDTIETIARKHGVTPRQLIGPTSIIAPQLYPHLVELVKEEHFMSMQRFVAILKMDTDAFLSGMLPHVLPILIKTQDATTIDEFKLHNVNVVRTIDDNLGSIIEHIFMTTQDSLVLADGLGFLVSVLNTKMEDLVEDIPSTVFIHFVLNLGNPQKFDQAKNAIQCLSNLTQHIQKEQAPSLEAYLMKEFLGTMNYFNEIMTKHKSIPEKENMMRSLHRFIEMLGKLVTMFRPKIMAFLKLAVKTPLESIAIEIWETFIKLLDLKVLGPYLNQIVFSVLPLVVAQEQKAYPIFEYLFVTNKAQLESFFKSIPFMPKEYPVLREISQQLELIHSGQPLDEQLNQLIQLFGNENTEVKMMTLNRLLTLLQEHRQELFAPDSQPMVSNLMKHLLIGCRDPYPLVQSRFAECLGELGAVDPERFKDNPIKLRSEPIQEKTRLAMAQDLIVQYLSRFVCSPSNTTPQDRAGFAIQEILHDCGINGKEFKGHEAQDLWNNFSPEVKEIIRPYQTSQYHLPDPPKKPIPPRTSSFFTPNISYRKWITNWVSDLVYRSSGPSEKIFMCCRGIIKDDIKICHYLLPYLIINIFEFGKIGDQLSISLEILSVLKNDTGPVYENGQMCTQRIFELHNSLSKWIEQRKQKMVTEKQPPNVVNSPKLPESILAIQEFLDSIPQLLLATASARCGAAATSLIHVESYIKKIIATGKMSKHQAVAEQIPLLQRIYHSLNDVDSLAGLSVLRGNDIPLDEKLVDLEMSGKWNDAFLYYSNACRMNDQPLIGYKLGQLKSLFHLGQHDAVITMSDGIKMELFKLEQYESMREEGRSNTSTIDLSKKFLDTKMALSKLNAISLQSAWSLGKWERINKLVHDESDLIEGGFQVSLGKILLSLNQRNEKDFSTYVHQARADVVHQLSSASMDSYDRCYPYLVQLHILRDIEMSQSLAQLIPPTRMPSATSQDQNTNSPYTRKPIKLIINNINNRFLIVQPNIHTREPLLTARRSIFEIFNLKQEASQCWLQISKYSRREKKFENSLNALLTPGIIEDRNYIIEKAKIAYCKGQTNEAISILTAEIQKNQDHDKNTLVSAKTHLLLGKWKQEGGSTQSDKILEHYKQSTKYQWEKGFLYLAKYYDYFFETVLKKNAIYRPEQHVREKLELEKQNVKHMQKLLESYGMSCTLGNQNVYASIPRFITILTDYGTTLCEKESDVKHMLDFESKSYKNTNQANNPNKSLANAYKTMKEKLIKVALDVPSHAWLLFFPQIASRIAHKNMDTYEVLQTIIVKVLKDYPKQSIWQFAIQLFSNIPERKTRADKCLALAKQNGDKKTFEDSFNLCNQLINLAMYDPAPQTTKKPSSMLISKSRDKILDPLSKLVHLSTILPMQRFMSPKLPQSNEIGDTQHEYFSSSIPTIIKVGDHVDILSSLQKPKKINLHSSDGNIYPFLIKPADDLRKDARTSEFMTMVNYLWSKDPETRKRHFHVQTYCVIPINADNGILEWLTNTITFRSICNSSEFKPTTALDNARIQKLFENGQNKLENFNKVLLPAYPATLYRWFQKQFPDPTSYLEARTLYTVSLATASMIGTMIGLGDRHPDNFLFSLKNGEIYLIDLNCIFWRGQTFHVPERVPFRLTNNLLDMLGVLGVEGPFRICCENAVRVMRENREALLGVVESVVHDPLWGKNNQKEPRDIMSKVNNELQGYSNYKNFNSSGNMGLPLSIEGQVNSLIQEATDPVNLSEMYVGWSPYL